MPMPLNSPTPPIDPTDTDNSDLIIDPATITEWVDGELTPYHKENVDRLAEKFTELKSYKEDVSFLRELLKETHSKEIAAPAHTVLHVLNALDSLKADSLTEAATKDTPSPAAETTPELSLSAYMENGTAIDPEFFPGTPLTVTLHKARKSHKRWWNNLSLAALLVVSLFGVTFFIIHSSHRDHLPITGTTKDKDAPGLSSPEDALAPSRRVATMSSVTGSPHDPKKDPKLRFTSDKNDPTFHDPAIENGVIPQIPDTCPHNDIPFSPFGSSSLTDKDAVPKDTENISPDTSKETLKNSKDKTKGADKESLKGDAKLKETLKAPPKETSKEMGKETPNG